MAEATRELTAEELFLLLDQYRSEDVLIENGIEVGIDFVSTKKIDPMPRYELGSLKGYFDGPEETTITIKYHNGEDFFRGFDIKEEEFIFSEKLEMNIIGHTNNFVFGTIKKEKLVVWHNIEQVSRTRQI